MTQYLTPAMRAMLDRLPVHVADLLGGDRPVVHALMRRGLARVTGSLVVRDQTTCPLCGEDDGACYCKYEAEEKA
jgi:hypothetical protein